MKYMVSILIASSLLVTIIHAGPIPDEFKDVAPGIRETCLKESGTAVELVEKAVVGEFVEDDNLKCYIKCLFDQFRLISKKGFNFDVMLTLSPPRFKDMTAEGIKKCRDTVGKPGDLCDLSFNIHKCFYNVNPELYFTM